MDNDRLFLENPMGNSALPIEALRILCGVLKERTNLRMMRKMSILSYNIEVKQNLQRPLGRLDIFRCASD